MAGGDIPKPEPKEIDEQNWLQLRDLIDEQFLRGEPVCEGGKCGNCCS